MVAVSPRKSGCFLVGKGLFYSGTNGLTHPFDHQQDTDRDTSGTHSYI